MRGLGRGPGEIAIVGYDDIAFAEAAVVPPDLGPPPAQEMGRRALELLVEQTDAPESAGQQVEFAPELVVRASTVG